MVNRIGVTANWSLSAVPDEVGAHVAAAECPLHALRRYSGHLRDQRGIHHARLHILARHIVIRAVVSVQQAATLGRFPTRIVALTYSGTSRRAPCAGAVVSLGAAAGALVAMRVATPSRIERILFRLNLIAHFVQHQIGEAGVILGEIRVGRFGQPVDVLWPAGRIAPLDLRGLHQALRCAECPDDAEWLRASVRVRWPSSSTVAVWRSFRISRMRWRVACMACLSCAACNFPRHAQQY